MRLGIFYSNAENSANLLTPPIRIQVMINKRLIANIRPDHHHEIILQKQHWEYVS